jgi:hypothetical protein
MKIKVTIQIRKTKNAQMVMRFLMTLGLLWYVFWSVTGWPFSDQHCNSYTSPQMSDGDLCDVDTEFEK